MPGWHVPAPPVGQWAKEGLNWICFGRTGWCFSASYWQGMLCFCPLWAGSLLTLGETSSWGHSVEQPLPSGSGAWPLDLEGGRPARLLLPWRTLGAITPLGLFSRGGGGATLWVSPMLPAKCAPPTRPHPPDLQPDVFLALCGRQGDRAGQRGAVMLACTGSQLQGSPAPPPGPQGIHTE